MRCISPPISRAAFGRSEAISFGGAHIETLMIEDAFYRGIGIKYMYMDCIKAQ